jgi:signal transduction histidine kinase
MLRDKGIVAKFISSKMNTSAKKVLFINAVWDHLRSAFGCRLCKRITVAVFFSILVIEGGILFFSIKNYERDRLLEVEREAVVVMRSILRSVDSKGTLDSQFSNIFKSLRDGSVLVGVRIFDQAGKELIRFGESPGLFNKVIENPSQSIRRRTNDNTRMDILWPIHRIQTPYLVLSRIDTSEIDNQIVAFVWRIAGLVLLISVFVTIVTMLVLNRMVFTPLINLGVRLSAVGSDPNNPEKYYVDSQKSDEWGDVNRAFNRMLQWAYVNLEMIKKKENELQVSKEKAEKANMAKSKFLSSMSHELRTPMNAVLGFAQMLKYNPKEPLSKSQEESVGHILTGGQHLLTLIDDVLDLAKIEAGKVELVIEDILATEIVNECLPLIATLAEEQGINVSVPDGAIEVPMVRADYTRFKQVLLNLMSNAVKYNQKNGTVSIAIEEVADKRLRIAVTDTGVGIPENKQDELFKPFNRLGAETSGIKGTGIGLVVCKDLIERMSGAIGMESEVGKGATFWIELPLADRDLNKATAA